MSRKVLGAVTPQTPGTDDKPLVPAPLTVDPLKTRPLLGADALIGRSAQPVGAISASLSMLSERGKHADEIEKQLAAGAAVVELDTALIDPSFVADRMPLTDEGLADLVEAIRDNTQLSPVLLRPHPDREGRYQTAFGHRRIRVAQILKRPVRAVVRNLSDEDMAIAQGQENSARKDLSYIEKAMFATRLQQRFKRDLVTQALSIHKGDLSKMIAVADRIPEDIVAAIGPAAKTGRRGWIELADLLQTPSLLQRAREKILSLDPKADSDQRFKIMLDTVKVIPMRPSAETWKSAKGAPIARVTANKDRVTLAVDRKKSPEFADFVLNRLKVLYEEFERERKAGESA